MSKGPGKWQRMILDALEKRDKVDIVDLLPDWRTNKSQYSALMRAQRVLWIKGVVWTVRGTKCPTAIIKKENIGKGLAELETRIARSL